MGNEKSLTREVLEEFLIAAIGLPAALAAIIALVIYFRYA